MAPLLRGTPNSADPKPAVGLEQRILIKRWRKYVILARAWELDDCATEKSGRVGEASVYKGAIWRAE